uniref:Integrase catalytic domain-containing protein n=1 Tax=Trichuris muris TaxID=70415 RepID=A0A5S6Q0A6_TRIMR
MIQSDNFRTFKNAERELQELFKTLDIEQISREMNTCRIHWSITERAPWAGGYWERLVKSIKAPLRKVLGRTTLDFDELRTVLCEIEAQVNSRPLTFVGDDAADGEALTPFHFLTGRGHQALPERKVDLRTNESRESQEPDLRKRWAYQQSVLAHFWKRWRQEYIVTLSSRKKWLNSRPEPQIGDIVLISEDNVPRGRWPMGRIVRKCPGNDSVTRTVQLKTVKGLITRPLARLHLLEAAYRGDSGDGLPSMGAAGCSGQSG